MPHPLEALAARVVSDPWFLASVLAAYQRRHRLDDPDLADLLGCPVATLTDLRLCCRPGVAAPARTAEEDVRTIAATHRLDTAALLRVVQEGRGT
jgi:hypothetical protein